MRERINADTRPADLPADHFVAGEINEQGRRAKLAEQIRRKGNGHRNPVALYTSVSETEPAAVGIVQAIETEGVRIAGSFVPWSGLRRVELWQEPTERTNEQREESAFRTVLYYQQHEDNEDTEDAIVDLVTNLMHLANRCYGLEPDELQRIAREHYDAETATD